jgi:hypothetical protein
MAKGKLPAETSLCKIERILGLYRDAAKFRRMREGEAERDRNGRTRDARSLSPKPRDRGLDLG